MRTPTKRFLKPSRHRFHRNNTQWLVSFQSLVGNDLFLNEDGLIPSPSQCLTANPDTILPIAPLYALMGQELMYFLGFYNFPKDKRKMCGRGIRPSVDLLHEALRMLNTYMPKHNKIRIKFYKKDGSYQIARSTLESLLSLLSIVV